MVTHKFDETTARKPVKLWRSPQGDTYNIRVMLARGLKHDTALWALEKIRNGEIAWPDTFAWNLTKNDVNLDQAFIDRRERMAARAAKIEPYKSDPLMEARHRSEKDAYAMLPDLIRDDEVKLPRAEFERQIEKYNLEPEMQSPKPKKKSRKRAAAKSKQRKAHATPARDRAAREAMKELGK